MIKSLLDADERDEQPRPESQPEIAKTPEIAEAIDPPAPAPAWLETAVPPANRSAAGEDLAAAGGSAEPQTAETQTAEPQTAQPPAPASAAAEAAAVTADDGRSENAKTAAPAAETPMFQSAHQPETPADTARKSGLAYAAAITLLASVVFMLILGWFVDLLVGSSPWGIVGGIILGAAIGFVQFFRLTSQIFKNKE